ncbi:MAG: cation:proton antiporter [Dehalococcoidia bacterium]|nr:cation:proton antiporter [Dehalococcoidia bacterium]
MQEDLIHRVTILVLQLAVILAAAQVAGEVCERYLRIPAVLGELIVGVALGPFALGGLSLFGVGPLFPVPEGPLGGTTVIPVSLELYSLAQVAAIVLLFVSGLETDLRLFLRYVGPASVVAIGGVVVPFFLGAFAVVAFGLADSLWHPTALFMGAIMTATSVGITARVLADLGRLNTSEGVTVLGAAVIDDVLGIMVLTIVVGIAAAGQVSLAQVALIGAKAIGFWVGLTGLGILLSSHLDRFLGWFGSSKARLGLALALALLGSGVAELAGLAMIIGAYSMGLAFSTTQVRLALAEPLQALYHALVPVFFVVMGMLVDLKAMAAVLAFGLVITLLAIVGKVLGAGAPSLAVGFNLRGAWRVGIGMLPRGEVALIMAGVGLARGVIGADIFGVAIMMTVVTTIMAPLLLVPAFRKGGEGTRRRSGRDEQPEES